MYGLNEQQSEAVICEDKNILVLAGAGSGKTRTLLAKINYMIERQGIDPSEILVLSFSSTAKDEIIDRLIIQCDEEGIYKNELRRARAKSSKQRIRNKHKAEYSWIDNINIKTFHGLGIELMRTFAYDDFDNRFKIIDIANEKEGDLKDQFMQQVIIKLSQQPDFLLNLKQYILNYYVDVVFMESSKKKNTYEKKYTSLKGDKVASKSEQYICDWLYRHNIEYIYEKRTNLTGAFNFYPDFYLPVIDLHFEHVSNLSSGMEEKIKQFKKSGKKYACTEEEHASNTAIFNLQLERLIKDKLPPDYHYQVALHFDEEFKLYQVQLKSFRDDLIKVLSKCKINLRNIEDVAHEASQDEHKRVREFYAIALPIIQEYQKYCIDNSYLDFTDIITRSTNMVESDTQIKAQVQKSYSYVLIDEFQDVNNTQLALAKCISSDHTSTFCVGDDWQSIYGFQGANVELIMDFEKHFKTPRIIPFTLNYRCPESVVKASNTLIQHNVKKREKQVIATNKDGKKISLNISLNIQQSAKFLEKQVASLLKEEDTESTDILILYRNSNHFINTPYQKVVKKYKLRTSTIHSSKGTEAKYVVILGLYNKYGFPNVRMTDRLMQVIKKDSNQSLLDEERRLMYVAMTRAQKHLYLLSLKGNESRFIKELPKEQITRCFGEEEVVEKVAVILCKNEKCKAQLDEKFTICPYCGEEIIK